MKMLEFIPSKNGVHKVVKTGSLRMNMGAISRSGLHYLFLPEPFVAFDKGEIEQILNRMKELEYDANNS